MPSLHAATDASPHSRVHSATYTRLVNDTERPDTQNPPNPATHTHLTNDTQQPNSQNPPNPPTHTQHANNTQQPDSQRPDSPHPLDLSAFRRNGHALVDWVADYLTSLGNRPVCEPVEPGDVRSKLPAAAPENTEPFEDVLADLDQVIVPGLTHWQHPGWFAYFQAMSSPAAVLGELAAAGIAVQGMLWSTSPALTELESHVLDWLVDLLAVPQQWKTTNAGGGTLTSGASQSVHTALVTAREQCRNRTGASIEQMVAYTSSHAHSSIEKGAMVAGLGHVRLLEVDEDFSVRPESLLDAIAADRNNGLTPAFVGSTVGTTGTASVDPVRHLGEIARDEQMWHHVDAAYAGSAMICDEFRHHQDGLELVDSYCFNPHKWLATNLDCSVLWVADRRPLLETLSILPPYLRNRSSQSGRVIDYRDWNVPLGRPFRALKLWFVLRSFGASGLRSMIRTHVRWAQWLSDRVDAHPRLQRIAPTSFALVSFVHADSDEATRALAAAINDSGRFYVTSSEVDGHPFIRVAIGSTWTTKAHVTDLWHTINTNS